MDVFFVGRAAAGGIQIAGGNNSLSGRIGGDVSGGGNSTGIGLDINNCGFNNVDIVIHDFSGAGGIGLRTQSAAQIFWSRVAAIIQNCDTLWSNGVAGTNNHFDIVGDCTAAQTRFAGVGPNTGDPREQINAHLYKTGTGVLASRAKISADIDLNSTAEQAISVNPKLLAAPKKEDVKVSISTSAYAGTAAAIQYLYVREDLLTATNITVMAKLSTALGTAFTGKINIDVSL